MWKSLKQGESVSAGDTLRYQSNSNSLMSQDQTYQVFKIEQHYFELIRKVTGIEDGESPIRKIVRYIDIGYNILLEKWNESLEAI
jgi:hypothetical protein